MISHLERVRIVLNNITLSNDINFLILAMINENNTFLAVWMLYLGGFDNLLSSNIIFFTCFTIDLIKFSLELILVINGQLCFLLRGHSWKHISLIGFWLMELLFDFLLELNELLLYFWVHIPILGQGPTSICGGVAVAQHLFLLVWGLKLLFDLGFDVIEITIKQVLVLTHDKFCHLRKFIFLIRGFNPRVVRAVQ